MNKKTDTPKATKVPFVPVFETREKLKLSQKQFWGRIGLSQSAGSRYESNERDTPENVRRLLAIAFGTKAQADSVVKALRGEK